MDSTLVQHLAVLTDHPYIPEVHDTALDWADEHGDPAGWTADEIEIYLDLAAYASR